MDSRPVIVFDGDDTLWSTEQLYDASRDRVAGVLNEHGLDGVRFLEVQRQLDLDRADRFGYVWWRFPGSSYLAARSIGATRRASGLAFLLCLAVFVRRAPLTTAARAVLVEMTVPYRLVLVTKGQRCVQLRRIRQSGLRKYFAETHVVADKTSDLFASLTPTGRPVISVGNSMRSDIYPALQAGGQAIYVPAHVWEHELVDPVGIQGFVTATTLGEVPELVRRLVI